MWLGRGTREVDDARLFVDAAVLYLCGGGGTTHFWHDAFLRALNASGVRATSVFLPHLPKPIVGDPSRPSAAQQSPSSCATAAVHSAHNSFR